MAGFSKGSVEFQKKVSDLTADKVYTDRLNLYAKGDRLHYADENGVVRTLSISGDLPDLDSLYVNKTGDTMTGPLNIGNSSALSYDLAVETLDPNLVEFYRDSGDVNLDGGVAFNSPNGDTQIRLLTSGRQPLWSLGVNASGGAPGDFVIGQDGTRIEDSALYIDTNDHTHIKSLKVDTIAPNETGVVVLNGDLYVQGTTTTVDSETLLVADNIITLNSNVTAGPPTEDAGIEVLRGDETQAQFLWDEELNTWVAGVSGNLEPILTGALDISGYVEKTGDTMTGALEINTSGTPLSLEVNGPAALAKNFIQMTQSGTPNIGDSNRDMGLYELLDDSGNSVSKVTYSSGQTSEYSRQSYLIGGGSGTSTQLEMFSVVKKAGSSTIGGAWVKNSLLFGNTFNPTLPGDRIYMNSDGDLRVIIQDEDIVGFTTTGATFYKDVEIGGDLIVQGTTTSVNTSEMTVEDNVITLSHGLSGNPDVTMRDSKSGIEVARGDELPAQFIWDEVLDTWTYGVSGDLKTFDGEFVNKSGDTMTGKLTLLAGITSPGISGTNSEVFGDGSDSNGDDNIVIGRNSIINNDQTVLIGHDIVTSGRGVFIGYGSSFDAQGTSAVQIGPESFTSGFQTVAIGESAGSAGKSVAIGSESFASGGGFGATAIGFQANANAGKSTAIGRNASNDGHQQTIVIGHNALATASGQIILGDDSSPMTQMYIGAGVLSDTPYGIRLNASGATGDNIAGSDMKIAGGRSTGAANGGDIVFEVSTASVSGATLNSLQEVARFDVSKDGEFQVYNDMVIDGDLTVQGTTTTVDSETVLIKDNVITLNSGISGFSTGTAGIEVDRGDGDNKPSLLWEASEERWTASTSVSGDNYRILTELDASLGGSVDCMIGQQIYTVTYGKVLDEVPAPVISLSSPTSASDLYIVGSFDVTDTNFKVVLSNTPDVTDYKINWMIPNADGIINVNNAARRILSLQAPDFDLPTTFDWVVNPLNANEQMASLTRDPVNPSLPVMLFDDDDTKDGVGFSFTVPVAMENVAIRLKSRGSDSSGGVVDLRLWSRSIADGTAITSWSEYNIDNVNLPTDQNYKFTTMTYSIAELGWASEQFVQCELVRNSLSSNGTDTYNQPWYLLEMEIEFF